MQRIDYFWLLLFFASLASAQEVHIHSHNDYAREVPFWSAWASGAQSIEVDIFLRNDTLFATHAEDEIIRDRTIENLYLQPLQKAITLKLGGPRKLQLLVDIKSGATETLERLVDILAGYPKIISNDNISIVISGNRPQPTFYPNYPDYIHFDYQSLEEPSAEAIREKIALVSLSFRSFSDWNGMGRLTGKDSTKIRKVIDQAHKLGKPFRFWASPDSKTAWKALVDMGADFVNTDQPYAASLYLNSLDHRTYKNSLFTTPYSPSYIADRTDGPVRNVILLIGDGNGLAQISAAALANQGKLTLTQLRSIGLVQTQSADDFTTDSAAAATAMATGTKTDNRALGMGPDGTRLENITELLSRHGFLSGCITTDAIVGATPAAFYAHRRDRSEEAGIVADLRQSKLSLLIAGRTWHQPMELARAGFTELPTIAQVANSEASKVVHFRGSAEVPGILEGRGNFLSDATKHGLAYLNARKKPFFLMVEGAKIDSYGHENRVAGIVSEGIDFDSAIAEAVRFADATKNTLVIVTADHETSGFSLPQGNLQNTTIEGDFTTTDHTGTMVPLFAYGPRSQEFQGIYANTEVFKKIVAILGVE